MNNLDQVKEKLIGLGLGENEIDNVVNQVNEIIIQKTWLQYVKELTEEQRKKLKDLSEKELVTFIKENKNQFPKLSQQKLEEIEQETWENCFASLNK